LVGTFHKDRAGLLAAAISFYVILSFVPLVLVLVSISGFVVHASDEVALELFALINNLFPAATGKALEHASGIIEKRHWFGILGLLALTWSASRVFNVAETALNLIWKPKKSRPYWKSRLLTLALVPVSVVTILFSFVWTSLNSLARHAVVPFLDIRLSETFFFSGLVPFLFPVLLSFLLFFSIYKILPGHKSLLSACVLGAVFASLAWEVCKLLFDLYIKEFTNLDKIYGSLGGIVILIMWVYLSAYILIIGAEVGANYQRLKEKSS
jgi:membrane protein